MKRHDGLLSRIFDAGNYFFLTLFSIAMIIPVYFVAVGSIVSEAEFTTKKFIVIPETFSLKAYYYIFSGGVILNSFVITIFITLVGTFINLAFTTLSAYSLSEKGLPGRSVLTFLIIFTIVFNGGLIPTFLTVKGLGLYNSYWALWLPVAISPFNLILIRNFFQEIPESLKESARIDGCNELFILARIILPLSKPALATFAVFYGVAHWNSFFSSILYLTQPETWPLQVWLRQAVLASDIAFTDPNMQGEITQSMSPIIKNAVIVIATVPILLVYPYLQKYFTKGILLGSVKG